jgi:site-specific DNA-methyltransferase (adenine-specific)
MSECKRVMKPGAHGLVWALPRTSHWTATALEEAGFEIRDVVTHLFGSGFPKSLDVSKAIDKAAGASRVAIGKNPNHRQAEDVCTMLGNPHTGDGSITAPATDAAKQWQGFGTALKPASEHWILIRKPLSEKTVAANVLKWGTGALNIDGSRVATQDNLNGGAYAETKGRKNATYGKLDYEAGQYKQPQGRFPANLIFSCPCDSDSHMLGCAVGELDRQSGQSKSSNAPRNNKNTGWKCSSPPSIQESPHSDSGGASRFFYVAKVSAAERNAGLEGMQKKRIDRYGECGQGATPQQTPRQTREETNHHPTVKPQKLMRYLIRMATPPGGTVLDPFMGSGRTLRP